MKVSKFIFSVLLAGAMLLSFTGCKKQTNYIPPAPASSAPAQPSAVPSATPTATPKATASPTPSATPSAKPSPTPTASAASVAGWNGSYAKELGTAGQISLSVSNAAAASFDFVLDAKGVVVQGTAHVQTDGAISYSGSDCSLTFQKSGSDIKITETKSSNPNVSFSGNYTVF